MLFERYIIKNYLKNFLVIFLGLDFFYVGVDLLSNYKNIPDSANLQILYTLFQALNAINYVLPLSVVFGMIVTHFGMIKSNELISLYASSISKRQLIKPFFQTAMALTLVYIGLNATEFVYANEYGRNLKKYNRISNSSEDLFLKHNNSYIYFQKLDPYKQIASGVTVFETNGIDLVKIMRAPQALFKNNAWELENVQITYKPVAKSLEDGGLRLDATQKVLAIENFKPKVMDSVYQNEHTLSIVDGVEALMFLHTQGINTTKIKATLFYQLFFPLFAPFLIVLLYNKAPIMGRYFNVPLVSSVFAFVTLLVWSGLFVLSRLSATGVLIAEVGILLPIVVLAITALYVYKKR